MNDKDEQIEDLRYIVNHVFMPLKLPQRSDHSVSRDAALSSLTYKLAKSFRSHVPPEHLQAWETVTTMLLNLANSASKTYLSAESVRSQLRFMDVGDVLAFYSRSQNAGVIVRKEDERTVFESFEASPSPDAVMQATAKLLCSYPGPAVSVRNTISQEPEFLDNLSRFLEGLDEEEFLDAVPHTKKAGILVPETRDTINPRYITELLTGILLGVGTPAEVTRISKRIGDDVLWLNAELPWRRAPLWLVIRVSIQTTLSRCTGGLVTYKSFMLFITICIIQHVVDDYLPHFSDDLLFQMSAKMSRRLYKLGSSASPRLAKVGCKVAETIRNVLEGRSKDLIPPSLPALQLSTSDFERDVNLTLKNSRSYIKRALSFQAPLSPSSLFSRNHAPRQHNLTVHIKTLGSQLSGSSDGDKYLTLIDFEAAVHDSLHDIKAWCSTISDVDSASVNIMKTMAAYYDIASVLYKHNPENMSIMFLTLFLLWVALDHLTLAKIPLLWDYRPEFEHSLFQSLLLRTEKCRALLQKASTHLSLRHARARYKAVLEGATDDRSFPVQYFRSSQTLQALKRRIEIEAEAEKQKKLQELQRKTKDYEDKLQRAHDLVHEQCDQVIKGKKKKKKKGRLCSKCDLEREAKAMKIDVHEWPLPSDLLQAACAVFELDCPTPFAAWRDATYHFVAIVLNPASSSTGEKQDWYAALDLDHSSKYLPLVKYARNIGFRRRIILGSSAKSFLQSHYRRISLKKSPSESAVSVKNALHFWFFDTGSEIRSDKSIGYQDISGRCTFSIPKGLYSNLAFSLKSTTHSTNEVLARQSECPPQLSLREFWAYASLRSGARLQWMNILRVLRDRSLNFREIEVYLLCMQAALQIGPRDTDSFESWHSLLNNSEFCFSLIQELSKLLAVIRQNWLELFSMLFIIDILLRVLSSSAIEDGVVQCAYQTLRDCRSACITWLEELHNHPDRSHNKQVQSRIHDVAATCLATFDTEAPHISSLLSWNNPIDVTQFVRAFIVLHEYTPAPVDALSTTSRQLSERVRRLAVRLESHLYDRIARDRKGLDEAIQSIWRGYRPDDMARWTRIAAPSSRWVTCKTLRTTYQSSQTVHYDLLSGSLLVDGKPFARLPSAITHHQSYIQLFAEQILEIVPSDLPGMQYVTRDPVEGHQVFFGLVGNMPIIKAKQSTSGVVLELIPSERLRGDIPLPFVNGHTHWLDLGSHIIEVRPNHRKWEPAGELDWLIHYSTHSSRMIRQSGQGKTSQIIDPASHTCYQLSRYLTPIELSEFHVVTWTRGAPSAKLLVELPRSGFSFFLNEYRMLQCRELSNFVIDKDQSTGTMFGLRSQLVLAPNPSDDYCAEEMRRVIIPRGTISYTTSERHPHIFIQNPESLCRVSYDVYKVDTVLGRLEFDGLASVTSRLYKVYLHAVSTQCLPDTLTQRTGTEEALRELRSASCLSFSSLQEEDVELLRCLLKLTPRRRYYPPHKRERMQSVSWGNLSSIAQHEGFFEAVTIIVTHAKRMNTIDPTSSQAISDFVGSDEAKDDCPKLLHRAKLRRNVIQRDGFASLDCDSQQADAIYRSQWDASREALVQQVSNTSAMVYRWWMGLSVSPPQNLFSLMESISSGSTLEGPKHRPSSLQFSRIWLSEPRTIWLTALNLCRKAPNKFQLLFTLPSMSYSPHYQERQDLVTTLFCVAYESSAGTVPSIPLHTSYTLSDGVDLGIGALSTKISARCRPLRECPEGSWKRGVGESQAVFLARQTRSYSSTLSELKSKLCAAFCSQWNMGDVPHQPPGDFLMYFDMPRLLSEVDDFFRTRRRNKELQEYTRTIQNQLSQTAWVTIRLPSYSFLPALQGPRSSSKQLSSLDLFTRASSGEFSFPFSLLAQYIQDHTHLKLARQDDRLYSLVARVRRLSQGSPYDIYSESLERSSDALASTHISDSTRIDKLTVKFLAEEDLQWCRDRMISSVATIRQAMAPRTDQETALVHAGLWPSLSTICLLRNMDLHHFSSLPLRWRKPFMDFARILIATQTSQRRVIMAKRSDYQDLIRELEHTKQQCYVTASCPDWLLLQIDGGFTLRDVQHQVAEQMISHGSHQSIALQLNMGEGKSSVIAPLAATMIADKTKLARLIVLKALAPQMAHTMENRLTGLANRRIYHLPFTRSTQLDTETLAAMTSVLEECKDNGGILIIQPEHILSMKLRAVECQLSKGPPSAPTALARIQHFLFDHARDILDESDEILHVRYQLVYTCGSYQRLQGHPNRWVTTQEILRLARKHLHQLFLQDSSTFAVQGTSRFEDAHPTAFPPFRFIQSSPATNQLLRLIVADVLEGRLSNCNLHHFRESEKKAFEEFISMPTVTREAQIVLSGLRAQGSLDENIWNLALLLRGLIAYEVLIFCLRDKRYRVDYGLDLRRSMLAVPYRAKDVPSSTAEFGHPDVIVLLTCLSYYLSGLSEMQLETCIRFLLLSDNPASMYDDWTSLIAADDLPESLKSFKGLNFDSIEQRRLLSEMFGHNQATIDFYLRTVVFPQQAKEFESKLVTSGWDIVEHKTHITTGFSGTNDFQHLLPAHISQRDPEHQLSTNARVLNYMLRDENNHYETFAFPDGLRFVEKLSRKQPKIRMLLDVGAQMLDVKNKEVVEHWLRHEPLEETTAAIYVNDQDELTVLHRNGYEEPLSTSHVNDRLGQCVVYLDDAHTRGIDIKLPIGFRAAVTLGPKVTKDRLAQGCMRMRRLGSGHSIAFFAPPEVEGRIRQVASKKTSSQISAEDVLLWAISETCAELKGRALQWAYQGVDHSIRYKAWSDFTKAKSLDGAEFDNLRRAWMQQEAHSLEELYGIRSAGPVNPLKSITRFPAIHQRCLKLGFSPTSIEQDTPLDEEQEREVSHEIEREEQVQRPSSKSPCQHHLSADVKKFVQTGSFSERSPSFIWAFSLLAKSPAELPNGWQGQLWATSDFARTVASQSPALDFFRPVQWVVSTVPFSRTGEDPLFVLVSSFEANELLPDIRRYMKVRLHVFTPRLASDMEPCDDLKFFAIPSLEQPMLPARVRMELVLFSGQLYLSGYDEYIELCKLLGVFASDLKGLPMPRVSHDGFIEPWHRQIGIRLESPFLNSPIPALTALMNIRLKGMSFSHTHLGKILSGRLLFPEDFGLSDEVSSSWFTRAISAATRFISTFTTDLSTH